MADNIVAEEWRPVAIPELRETHEVSSLGRSRGKRTSRIRTPTVVGCVGERNGNAKLSGRTVACARQKWQAGDSIRSLAIRYGVSKSTMANALKGITWKN